MTRVVKKAEERRQEIVFAAQELFLEKEYEKTTLQDVINKIGIAKGTVYYYFDSKEELLEAVVENMVNEYLNKIRLVLDQSTGNAFERMQSLIRASPVANEEMTERFHLAGNLGLHVRVLALTLMKLAPYYAEVIAQGCEEGVFKTDHPLEVVEILLAGIQFMTDVGVYPWNKEDLARRSAAIPALAEVLLGATKGSFTFLSKLFEDTTHE